MSWCYGCRLPLERVHGWYAVEWAGHVTDVLFVSGDGGSVRESVRSSGLHLVRAGTSDLSHRADTTAQRMSSERPGKVLPLVKSSVHLSAIVCASLCQFPNKVLFFCQSNTLDNIAYIMPGL